MGDMIAYLSRGGIVMIPLFLCSILGLAIVIEKSFNLRRRKVLIPEIISVIETISSSEDIKMATNICERNSGPFANIILVGLRNNGLPKEEMKVLIIDQGRQEVRTRERGLAVLETIAGIAPLLGLLGTVLGMIKVFTVITTQGT